MISPCSFAASANSSCENDAQFVLQVKHLCLQKRALLVQLYHLETRAAFRDDVHAPVGIFLSDRKDFCGASDLGKLLILPSYHAKVLAAVKAFGNHFPVARLENVQWQGCSRKQNEVERKQRQQCAQEQPPGCFAAIAVNF
jgi:hypothetical protein